MSKNFLITLYIIIFPFFPVYVYFPFTLFGKYLFIDILSFLLLFPVIIFFRKEFKKKYLLADLFVILYLLLSTFLSWYHTLETGRLYNISILIHRILFYFLPYYVFSRYVKNLEELKYFINVILIGSIPFLFLGFYEYITKNNFFLSMPFMDIKGVDNSIWAGDFTRFDDLRIKTSFAHPLSYGVYCSSMYFLVFALLKNTKNYAKRYLYILLMILFFSQLILSQSRGALVITIILTIILVLKNFNYKILLSMLLVLSIILILIINIFPDIIIILDMSAYDLSTFEYRINLWNEFLYNIIKVPLFGITSAYYLEWLSNESSVDIVSWYLETIVYHGIITLIIQIMFIILIAKNLYYMTRNNFILINKHNGKKKLFLYIIFSILKSPRLIAHYIKRKRLDLALSYLIGIISGATLGLIRRKCK